MNAEQFLGVGLIIMCTYFLGVLAKHYLNPLGVIVVYGGILFMFIIKCGPKQQ